MDKSQIEKELNRLSELMSAQDVARLDYEEQRAQLLPPEIKIALADLELEYQSRAAAVAENIAELEQAIKAAVLELGQSVKGERLRAVWSKGRVSWDTQTLDRFAAQHPEILMCRSEGEPSVSLRKK